MILMLFPPKAKFNSYDSKLFIEIILLIVLNIKIKTN